MIGDTGAHGRLLHRRMAGVEDSVEATYMRRRYAEPSRTPVDVDAQA